MVHGRVSDVEMGGKAPFAHPLCTLPVSLVECTRGETVHVRGSVTL